MRKKLFSSMMIFSAGLLFFLIVNNYAHAASSRDSSQAVSIPSGSYCLRALNNVNIYYKLIFTNDHTLNFQKMAHLKNGPGRALCEMQINPSTSWTYNKELTQGADTGNWLLSFVANENPPKIIYNASRKLFSASNLPEANGTYGTASCPARLPACPTPPANLAECQHMPPTIAEQTISRWYYIVEKSVGSTTEVCQASLPNCLIQIKQNCMGHPHLYSVEIAAKRDDIWFYESQKSADGCMDANAAIEFITNPSKEFNAQVSGCIKKK
jgi:hypothetical protein